jgi:hypothetical protein
MIDATPKISPVPSPGEPGAVNFVPSPKQPHPAARDGDFHRLSAVEWQELESSLV